MLDITEEIPAVQPDPELELTPAEQQALRDTEVVLDENSQEFVDQLVDKLMQIADDISELPLRPYQRPVARRTIESIVIGDGARITALASRQSGKSTVIGTVLAACMLMLPRLAKIYPGMRSLQKFRRGLWVGAFAPVDEQAEIIFGKISEVFATEACKKIMADPEIDEKAILKGRVVTLKNCGSFAKRTTCHPKATIEGRTYHVIIIDECFPAGTPVLTSEGWTDIETIVGSPERDWIVAVQGSDSVEWAHVTAAYRTRRLSPLIRVDHEYGTLYATANHPFVVGSRKVPASMLRPGENLSLVQAAPEPAGKNSQAVPQVHDGHLQQFASSEPEEPDGQRHGQGEDGADPQGDRASSRSPRGQRERTHSTSGLSAEQARFGLETRVCRAVWRKDKRRHSDALQDRLSLAGRDDRRGDRRCIAQHPEAAGGRPAQDYVVRESRVVGITLLEPGSPEFSRFSDGADHVYTLEVDHPSHTYVAAGILVGNCQGANNTTINKSVIPMGTATRATYIFTGTPWYTTNIFYTQIQKNKRIQVKRGRRRQNHFQWDWKEVAKYVPEYKLTVQDAMLSMGENSDEFRLSYKIEWLTAKGMFVTEDILNDMCDTSQQELVRTWTASPVIAGIDCARIQDRTVVTVLAVDWNHPDNEGFYPMYILNWLDLENVDWETQYFKITEFLGNYHIFRCGVDTGGVGDVVIDRLRNLMPHVDFVACKDSSQEQSDRWKYLGQIIDRRKLSWPYGAKIRERRVIRRFMQEMADLRKEFRGPYMKVEAPREADAHDDYPDSLAIAAWMARPEQKQENQVVVTDNVFYARTRSRPRRSRTHARQRQFQPLR